ncbi:MAG TPA: alpha/beta hydrolase [Sphingomicrobium sp.]|nr:alpha/beta hydrolase [Sphingomicrobium sp.]
MPRFEERRWTSGDGLNLFFRDYAGTGGEARLPLICLHGLTRNSKDFEDVAPLLAERTKRRVLVPDMRGRGRSDRDPDPAHYEPRTYAHDVLALMDALGIPRAQILGTSMGGIIAMVLASLRPKAVAGAILNDVGPAIGPEGLARILGYAGTDPAVGSWEDAADFVRRINQVAFPDYTDADWSLFAKRTFREGKQGPELDYDPAIAGALKAPSRVASAAAWLMFRRLARKRPTLLVRGATSDIVTGDIARRMKRYAPGLRLAEVPNVGHAPTLVEPVAIAAIEQFLSDVA